MKELKKFELRSAPRPITTGRYTLVSNTIAVTDKRRGGEYYCYVAFSDAFVDYVGKVLPEGVSLSFPAYLRLCIYLEGYELAACYAPGVGIIANRVLWGSDASRALPDWINLIKVRGAL